jgi:hypothetical protein
MSIALNLNDSRLQRSPRLQGLQCRQEAISHSLTNTFSSEASSPPLSNKQRAKMASQPLFGSFCALGSGTQLWAHSRQTAIKFGTSFISNAIKSYHHVNTLYDGIIRSNFNKGHSQLIVGYIFASRRPRWRNLERDFAQNCAQKKDVSSNTYRAIIFSQRNFWRNFSETSYYIRQALRYTTLFCA